MTLSRSIADIWKGLSTGQRTTLAGTVLLTISVMVGLIIWSQKPQLSLLYAGLDPSEAGKITDELRDQKITYEISQGGRAIYVPSQSVYDLRLKLASKGIPRGGANGGGVGFEIFDKPSFGLSDFLQKAQYYRALQGELARTISQMQEVESAKVFIVVPNDRLFTSDKTEAKASVFLQLRSNERMGKQQVNAVRFLVANGVEGLKPSRVTIMDNNGTVLAENEDNTAVGLSATQLEIRKSVETLYASKVQTMLDQVLGLGQSVVRVSVDMNFDTVQQTDEKFDPNAVVKTESTTTEDTATPVPQNSGQPGVVANTSTNASSQSATLMSTSKKQLANNQYEVGKTVLSTIKGVGDIRKVSVAVMVNKAEAAAGADGKTVERAKPADIEAIVKTAVGYVQEGKGKRNDEITVKEVAFAAPPTTEEAKLAATTSVKETIAQYSPLGLQVLLVILALGLFMYFKSMLAGAKAERLRTTLSLEDIMSAEKRAQLESAGPKQVTVGELSKLIKENPANMAQSLKNWLSQS